MPFKKVKYSRNLVQLVPEESDPRKTYADRPVLDDKHDPERKELRPGDPNPEPNAEEKRMAKDAEDKIKKRKAAAEKKKVQQKKKRAEKRKEKKKKKMNLPREENQHAINAFFALEKAREDD